MASLFLAEKVHANRAHYSERARKQDFITAFTFLELVVAVVILSSGIIFIYKGFLRSIDVSSYSEHYLYTQLWASEKLQNIENDFKQYKAPFLPRTSGSFKDGSKNFLWKISCRLLETTEKMRLYSITLVVSWKEDIRNIKLVRAAYVYYKI